ncbi:MAG: phosphoenolpyruvate carboxykinase [Thaumarchaeota archaeon]|nr:phosphoenolpyruvate carboxykinase [Nitrososphaerota archaeon]
MGLLGEEAWKLLGQCREIDNPRVSLLQEAARQHSVPNNDGLLVFHSRITARSPDVTVDNVNAAGEDVRKRVREEVKALQEYIRGRDFYIVDRSVGSSQRLSLKVRAAVSAKHPHLALMFAHNYFPSQEDVEPNFLTIDIPEWPRKGIYVDPEDGVTLILGTDYYGELKMSALRLAMNAARNRGHMLGVHAGSKFYHVQIKGEQREKGVLIFGLSGTGKSTISMASHGLQPPEKTSVRQDDIVVLDMQGYASGTEMNLYPKTDTVNEIPALKAAVTHPQSVLENVAVKDGRVDFDDTKFCANGRAIGIRDAMEIADGGVDLPRVDALLFLTRRNDYPVASRLISPEQAVAYFMLGESVRTAAEAGKAGESLRVPGFDPFIIEPKSLNGVLLHKILKANPSIQAFVLNTGFVGDVKIPPSQTLPAVLGIVTDSVKWSHSEILKLDVAEEVSGSSLSKYDPSRTLGGEYAKHMVSLRQERRTYLQRFQGLEYLADTV